MPLFNKIEVGKRLAIKREFLGYKSARPFAEAAGIDQSQYSKVENGTLALSDKMWDKLESKYQLTELDKSFILLGSIVPRDTLSLTVREPGPEASLEELLKAKREFVHAAEATEQRIYDLLSRGSGSSSGGTPSGPVQKGSGPKKGTPGKGHKGWE